MTRILIIIAVVESIHIYGYQILNIHSYILQALNIKINKIQKKKTTTNLTKQYTHDYNMLSYTFAFTKKKKLFFSAMHSGKNEEMISTNVLINHKYVHMYVHMYIT